MPYLHETSYFQKNGYTFIVIKYFKYCFKVEYTECTFATHHHIKKKLTSSTNRFLTIHLRCVRVDCCSGRCSSFWLVWLPVQLLEGRHKVCIDESKQVKYSLCKQKNKALQHSIL